MNITLITCGSRGDIQPMLALTLKLKHKGHRVLLAGPPENKTWALQSGCPYFPFGNEVTDFISRLGNTYGLVFWLAFARFIFIEMALQLERLPSIIAGADLVVGSSLAFALPSVAEAMGLPYRYISFTPMLFPSKDHPFPVFPFMGLGPGLNQLTWGLGQLAGFVETTRKINIFRQRFHLSPVEDLIPHVLGISPLVATDREIAVVPEDAEALFHPVQTGYMHLDQPVPPYPELERFLDRGGKTLYAGFGSMSPKDQVRIFPMILKAARSVECQLVTPAHPELRSRYAGAKDVFLADHFPHQHIFPRMTAVLHHGGAGTTATAALCGAPQVIVPQILDQHYWGDRIHRMGLGPKPVKRMFLTPNKLQEALETCLSTPGIQETARRVSLALRKKNGTEETALALENSLLTKS